MINVGVVGLGMMGLTHLDVYAKRKDVRVVAVADTNPDRLSGKARAVGNVEGQAQGGFDFNQVKKYSEGSDLIKDPDIHLVDICLQTQQHVKFGVEVLKAGKHLLLEKPLARTFADTKKLIAQAEKASTFAMCAMCMRFWPGWTWLKKMVQEQTYGKVLAAHFRRVANHPGPTHPFYSNGELCGGGILDLHIHDVDFVRFLLGEPQAVTTRGYSKITNALDHVLTHYHYDDVPLVTAEGGWAMSEGFGFRMQFAVNFERATATFGMDGGSSPLMLYQPGQAPQAVALEAGMGYEYEIAYLLDCIAKGERPSVVTLEDAAKSVKLVEAEVKSVTLGRTVTFKV